MRMRMNTEGDGQAVMQALTEESEHRTLAIAEIVEVVSQMSAGELSAVTKAIFALFDARRNSLARDGLVLTKPASNGKASSKSSSKSSVTVKATGKGR